MNTPLAQLYASFFSLEKYIDISSRLLLQNEPQATEQKIIEMHPLWISRRKNVQKDLLSSFVWAAVAALIAILLLASTGRISPSFPIATGKLLAAIGTWLAAWPTWFALATIEDTWDADSRVDLMVRTTFFKLLFFPGMVIAIIGATW